MIDPVSNNLVPKGALPEEVRDNVDIKVSAGEYVLPADVVRYLGLDQIEKLVDKAKQGIEQLDQKGRVGGAVGNDDLPFSPEELIAQVDSLPTENTTQPTAVPKMAAGGLVAAPTMFDTTNIFNQTGPNGQPLFLPMNVSANEVKNPPLLSTSVIPVKKTGTESSYTDRQEVRANEAKNSRMAGNVDTWNVNDFGNYGKQKNSPVVKGIEAGISTLIPFGGLAVKGRNNYLDKAVPGQIEKMLSTGFDNTGKPLTTEQKTALKDALTRVNEPKSANSGLKGLLGGLLGGGSTRGTTTTNSAKGNSDRDRPSTSSKPTTKPSSGLVTKPAAKSSGKDKPASAKDKETTRR